MKPHEDSAPGASWHWPLNLSQYDQNPLLSSQEQEHLALLVARAKAGAKGWHLGAKSALGRLLRPLYDVMDHVGATAETKRQYTIRTTAVCLLIRAMHHHKCSFWAFTTPTWYDILGRDFYAYQGYHGLTANARQQMIAVAYLLCGYEDLDKLGTLSFRPLARRIFGREVLDGAVCSVVSDLNSWGYTKKGNVTAVHNALSKVLLAQRSPSLEDLTLPRLLEAYKSARAKITRRGLVFVSFVLACRGVIPHCIADMKREALKERIDHRVATVGVPPLWLSWCQRWFATSTLQRSSRMSTLYRLFQVGRWLAQTHPGINEPSHWSRQTCAEYIAAVDRATIGQWSTPVSKLAERIGQPYSPKGKEGAIKCMRVFLTDCQEWGWVPRNLSPARDLRTPSSIRALIGPDPRVINDTVWAKLVWAGINLIPEDLEGQVNGRNLIQHYPSAMVKALALAWLFTGLRLNEILRLRVGCIRWQDDAGATSGAPAKDTRVCLLDVPVNKTGVAFTKPVDALVGEAIASYEAVRAPQPAWTDRKTGEQVQLLFSLRGRPVGRSYLNRVIIPLLCQKAGVPQEDPRGRVSVHRARATIATQLYNAKEPLTLFELQEWLGHRSPASTQYYAKISPTKLTKSFAAAGYFARNLRTIEVLIDQDVIKGGAAANGEPWKFYDLGHGYCTYDFFDQCPHRMACAKCSFYRPKGSTQAQILEGKANLQRMLQEIPLTEEERAAVEDGVQAMQKLCKQLESVPTPSGLAPITIGAV